MSSTGDALIHLKIDGKEVAVAPMKKIYDAVAKKDIDIPTTIYDAAQQIGVSIPILCHREHVNPVAVCRACVVDLYYNNAPSRVLAPACYRAVEAGMDVRTSATSQRVQETVRVVAELLMSDHPAPCAKQQQFHDCELELLAERVGVRPAAARFPKAPERRRHDDSSLVIAVDHNAC